MEIFRNVARKEKLSCLLGLEGRVAEELGPLRVGAVCRLKIGILDCDVSLWPLAADGLRLPLIDSDRKVWEPSLNPRLELPPTAGPLCGGDLRSPS